ncbi:MAG: AsmA family protein [Sphingomonas bacterium]|nr:AsmA family protein [Sphingomonas bacterium]MDB5689094.1 AsmA family protein [Sphingomonas bacterium]
MADIASSTPPAPPSPARTGRRDPARGAIATAVAILSTIVGLILLAWLILFVTKGRFLKPTFEKYSSRFSERQVRVAGDFQLYFAPFNVKFLAEGLTVSNPAWATRRNLFEAALIDTRVSTWSLLFGKKYRVDWLELADSHADLEWDKAHRSNTWTFSTEGEPFEIPDIYRGQVSGTQIRYRDPKMALLADIKVDTIKAQDTKFASAIRFSGGGTMRREPFTLSGALRSPNELMAGGRNDFALHAAAARTKVDVSGTMPGLTQLEGSDLLVRVRGQNLQDAFELFGLVTPDTRAYQLRSKLTKAGDEWRFTRLTGNYGNSDLSGSMTVSMPNNRARLVADLRSRRVDIVDIAPFIGYEPNAVATKGPTAAVAQTGGTPRLLPDAPLRIDAIKAFDAHVDYKVDNIRQPFVPISNIALTLDLDRSLLKLSPLTFDLADSGHLAADISINARVPAVLTDYDIRLSPTPLNKLFHSSGLFNSGTTGTIKARVQMKGRGDTVRDSLASSNGRIAIILPRGTFWTQYIQLAEFDIGLFLQKLLQDQLKKPIEVNCGLIAFTVKDGVAAADPVLIDTDKNVMTAKGGFSFKDESLDMAFRADGKKISLFSGQSPVGINGYFAKPGYQIITPQLLARGGAGLALGVVASPLAAILAFVDVGDAKDTACGPVLAGATAAAQRTSKGEKPKDIGTRSENAKEASGKQEKKKFLGIF